MLVIVESGQNVGSSNGLNIKASFEKNDSRVVLWFRFIKGSQWINVR